MNQNHFLRKTKGKNPICHSKHISDSYSIEGPNKTFIETLIPKLFTFLIILVLSAGNLFAQRQMEKLGRGVVAVKSNSQVFISWRLLGTDPSTIAFNVYRGTTKINQQPISGATNFIDSTGTGSEYYVKAVLNGTETGPAYSAIVTTGPYFNLPLQIPPGGVTPVGEAYTYSPNDASAADLDGDGEYEIILKWDPSNAKDNSQAGYTGNVYIDAYKLNGTRLWRIDLGRNIRAGAHYTQFIVYDLDGDGRAEMTCRTGDGTIDGAGVVIGNPLADYRNSGGYILEGPEYLTVFNGLTGRAMSTVNHLPERGDVCSWGNDGSGRPECYGNRVDRFVSGVAYLDGKRPSLIVGRGYYDKLVRAAWDYRNGKLSLRWLFNSKEEGNNFISNQGNHGLTIADVDGDGKDEICNGSSMIDDDGKALWSAKLGHGDAHHLSDFDPDRPGFEVWMPCETPATNGNIGAALLDAKTGEIIWKRTVTSGDIGRAMAADIDPNYRGAEVWAAGATGGVFDVKGNQIATTRPSINFGIWWDGDLSRELLDQNRIDKWNPTTKSAANIFTATGATSNNGTKATPALSADLFGDWREEVILRSSDNSSLRIYTTTIPTNYRFYTLMHDPQYRVAIAWQNTAYNQPPHPGFYLGTDMTSQPQANIVTAALSGVGEGVYQIKPTHSGLCLNVSDRINQASCDSTNGNQVWKISQENGFYSLYSAGSKKFVGFDGTNVVLTGSSGKKLFKINALENGSIQINSVDDTLLFLTVGDNGTLLLASNSDGQNQKFSLTPLSDKTDCNGDWGGTAFRDGCSICIAGNTGRTACDASLATGVYNIKTNTGNFCVGAGDPIAQQSCDTLDNQVWHVTKFGSVYQIFSKEAQKYLGFVETDSGKELVLTTEKKQFLLSKTGESSFSLSPTSNLNVVVEIGGNSDETGAGLQFGDPDGSLRQQFGFDKVTINLDCNGEWKGGAFVDNCGLCVAGSTGKQPCVSNFPDVDFRIRSVSSGLCLSSDSVFLSQQTCTGVANQQWRLNKEGGLYSISNVATGKYLSYNQAILGADNIFSDFASRKLFRIEAAASGSYYIYPSDNLGIRFDVWNRSTTPGGKISYYTPGTGTNQRFLIEIIRKAATVEISGREAVYTGQRTVVAVSTIPSDLKVKVTYNGDTALPVNAGTYIVEARVEDIVYQGSDLDTLVIQKAPLTFTAENKTRLFAENNPPLTFTITGFVNREDASVLDSAPVISTSAVKESPDGVYPISFSEGEDNNYSFIYNNGALTITGQPVLAGQYRVFKGLIKPNDNHIRPHFNIVNIGSVPVAYTDLKIRYWYTKEGDEPEAFWCDYAALGTNKVKGNFFSMSTPAANANRYLEVGFTSNGSIIANKSSGEIQTRFNKTNWSNYSETDDYSYDPTKTDYTNWNKITLYYKGVLVWGIEPAASGLASTEGSEILTDEVSVYSNPSSSTFNVRATGSFAYSIFDQLGNLQESGEGQDIAIVGGGLKQGIYTIRVQTDKLTSLKLIKE